MNKKKNIRFLYLLKSGKFILCSETDGLYVYDDGTYKVEDYGNGFADTVRVSYENGRLEVSALGKKIGHFSLGTDHVFYYANHYTTALEIRSYNEARVRQKKGEDIITLSNYRIFCNMIRGKLIYEEDICEDIIGKLIPIIKTKYPKDDPENLNYKHVTIILEFLVNYMYGG